MPQSVTCVITSSRLNTWYANSTGAKAARSDEVSIGNGWFADIVLFSPVTRAEHLQCRRIIARVRPVVQQAGMCEAEGGPADRCDHRSLFEELVHFRNDRCLCRVEPGICTGSMTISPGFGRISLTGTSGVRWSPPMVVIASMVRPHSTNHTAGRVFQVPSGRSSARTWPGSQSGQRVRNVQVENGHRVSGRVDRFRTLSRCFRYAVFHGK